MIRVSINTYGSINKEAGWSSKEIKLEQDRVMLEDVLRAVKLGKERTISDLVADENGCPLWNPKNLKSNIENEDVVTAMDILTAIGGG